MRDDRRKATANCRVACIIRRVITTTRVRSLLLALRYTPRRGLLRRPQTVLAAQEALLYRSMIPVTITFDYNDPR